MLTSLILTGWLLVAPLVTCFNFTGPIPGTSLNLSASAIDITWSSDNSQYSQLDLKFKGPIGDGGTTFSYTLVQNLSVADGQYSWKPFNISEALQDSNATLKTGKDYQFEADLHDKGSSSGAIQESGNYAVAGYEHMSGAVALQLCGSAAFLVMASLLIAVAA